MGGEAAFAVLGIDVLGEGGPVEPPFNELPPAFENTPYTAFIPVVILSARADDETKVKAAGLFGEEYIVKPVTVEDLSSRIEGVLSRYRGR